MSDFPHFRRNVLLLAACQALANSTMTIQVTLGGLTGQMLAADRSLATLPVAAMICGTAAATVPVSLLMGRWGRRRGFLFGGVIGVLASALACLALLGESFLAFCLGLTGFGVFSAVSQHYRFTAAEVAPPVHRARSISLVMAGGVAAAVLGPQIVKLTFDSFMPHLYLGSFAAAGVLVALGVLVQTFIGFPPRITVVAAADSGPARPLSEIARQPAFIVAVIAAALGYAVMSFVMTATPLAMLGCGFGLDESATVIQLHVLGMFGPSFFTGSLINRFGVLRIIITGTILSGACAVVAMTGLQFDRFALALALLGIGWNFTFIGGTTLLTETYRPAERARVQGLNDFIVFAAAGIASLSSGGVVNMLGWDWVLYLALPMVSVAFLVTMWLQVRRAAVS